MNPRQIFLNAVTTFTQELLCAGILFLLYRFLIRTLGIERFGVWSIVLATTSVVTLANQGFSASIVKFVAKYAAQEKSNHVATLLETATLTTGLAAAVAMVGLYPAARSLLKLLLPIGAVAEARQVLPFALVSLWLNLVGGVLLAGLAGLQKITYRNYIITGCSALLLLLVYALVPGRGLLGLACAQTAQAAACLIAAWLLLRRELPRLPLIPRRWDRALFREMLAYGAHFQLITISQAVREPTTKVLLAKFGGLAMTGFYDMASRWVVSFRELIVQANQVLVPTVSHLQQRDANRLPALYRDSYRLILFLSVPTFATLFIAAPLVSRIWIGTYEQVFVTFVGLLAAGWLINSLANPAYVFDLGTGDLRWVSFGCFATAVLNATLGFAFGIRFGGIAVVAVSAFSLAIGYVAILVAYHVQNCESFRTLLPAESGWIVLSSAVSLLIFVPALSSTFALNAHTPVSPPAASLGLLALVGIPMWFHPLRKRLMNWLLSRLPA